MTIDTERRGGGGGASIAFADLTDVTLVKKTTPQTVNNSTTLVNDSELVIAVEANSLYMVETALDYESSNVADFKATFSIPTGARMTANTGNAPSPNIAIPSTIFGAGFGAVSTGFRVLSAVLKTEANAGNLTLQWAQNLAEVSDTIVRAGSQMWVRKLA